MDRRKFISRSIIGAGALTVAGIHDSFAIHSRAANKGMFVGTPVLPEYLYEKGIANSLDEMKELSGVNTVMTFSHDHVFRQYRKGFATKESHDGKPLTNVWVRTDPKYYDNPDLQGRTDDYAYAGVDVLDELYDAAKPRDMKVYARILEPYVITGAIKGFEAWPEVNALGEQTNHVCFNHPDYIAYWQSVVTDLITLHPYLHGFKFGQERGGPMLSAMGKGQPGKCFCEHCRAKAKKQGIDVEEARKGLIAINEYGNALTAGERPVDGNFVTFMRILFQYPEILAWEQFWMDSREHHRKVIYKTIKAINENVQVGWHMDHGLTWDLVTRATWDYAKMSSYSDWLSVAVYFDSMGRRSKNHYERNYKDILFGDAREEYSYPMYLSMLGYDPKVEPSLDQHRKHDTSFSAEYVYQECKRAVTAINGGAQIYARPGFDMPGYDCNVKPREVYKATTRALDAGVNGLWCGREWDELNPKNAEAFGNAVRDYQGKKQ